MKKLTMVGIGGAVAGAAIISGLGVAFAHGPGHHDGGMMMNGASGMHMSMDSATIAGHMQQMMGDEAYAAMRAAMGDATFEQMLSRMAGGCEDMSGMMSGQGSDMPGHESHHGSAVS